jgi:hypothetical protein
MKAEKQSDAGVNPFYRVNPLISKMRCALFLAGDREKKLPGALKNSSYPVSTCKTESLKNL